MQGREGELISVWYITRQNVNFPLKDCGFLPWRKKAILEGFQQLKDGHEYDDLYYSAVARSEADWLVGINATRLFTVLYHHRLIVGRVQTPTLAMLVEREKEHRELPEREVLSGSSSDGWIGCCKQPDKREKCCRSDDGGYEG